LITHADTDIFALLKPQFQDITVHFFAVVGHINKWNNYTSYKWKSGLW